MGLISSPRLLSRVQWGYYGEFETGVGEKRDGEDEAAWKQVGLGTTENP